MKLLLGCLLALTSWVSTAQPGPAIDYWKVPWEKSRPRDPAIDGNGVVWFVGQTADYIAAFDPKNQQFRKMDLDKGVGPHNVILGEDRHLWYAGNRAAHIGRFDLEQGIVVEKICMPDAVKDPHTLVADGKGHVWFTAQGSNVIGRVTLAGRKVEMLAAPMPNALPYGITVDAAGRPWANLLGAAEIISIDPKTMKLERIKLPREAARTRRIGVSSDGGIWYTDYAAGHVGRIDAKSHEVKEWPLPAGAKAKPYALTIDDKDRVWISDTGAQPNRLLVFEPKTGKFITDVEVRDARGAIRHMVFHKASRAIWFGTDTDYLVRVKVP